MHFGALVCIPVRVTALLFAHLVFAAAPEMPPEARNQFSQTVLRCDEPNGAKISAPSGAAFAFARPHALFSLRPMPGIDDADAGARAPWSTCTSMPATTQENPSSLRLLNAKLVEVLPVRYCQCVHTKSEANAAEVMAVQPVPVVMSVASGVLLSTAPMRMMVLLVFGVVGQVPA